VSGDRYRLPDPKCKHAPTGRVYAGDPQGAYASTYVCDRPACIEDAKAWAEAEMRLPAEHAALPGRARQPGPEPSLFDFTDGAS
jgi:hypothetical protein